MPRGRRPLPKHLRVLKNRNHTTRKPRNDLFDQTALATKVPAPEYLDDIAAAEWDRIATQLYNLQVLTFLDAAALATYCQAFSFWRRCSDEFEKDGEFVTETSNGTPIRNPLLSTVMQASRDLIKCCTEFGMTPSSRARGGHIHNPVKNPAEQFFD